MRERFGAPYAVMHRADLADALYKACRRFANIDILFGVRSWDVVSHARGVTVSIDEANGQTRTGRAHAFIGADGVHSRTRTDVLGGPRAALSAAHRLAHAAALRFGGRRNSRWTASRCSSRPGYHLVCYPLPHRRQVNRGAICQGAAETDRRAGTRRRLPWSVLAEPAHRHDPRGGRR